MRRTRRHCTYVCTGSRQGLKLQKAPKNIFSSVHVDTTARIRGKTGATPSFIHADSSRYLAACLKSRLFQSLIQISRFQNGFGRCLVKIDQTDAFHISQLALYTDPNPTASFVELLDCFTLGKC